MQRIVGDNHFKVRAFNRAARLVRDHPRDVDDLVDRNALYDIDGIGESIEAEIEAIRRTGKSPRHTDLLRRVGKDFLQLKELSGLGDRRLQILFQDLGVRSLDDLKDLAESGRLDRAPHFGGQIVEKLRAEIASFERSGARRTPLPQALGLAESIRLHLLQLTDVDRAEIAGSIRRGRDTIGDIDILVTTDSPHTVAAEFRSMPDVVEVLIDGDTRTSVRIAGDIQVDLRILEPHLFGAGLHYFTGSKDHHIKMRLRSKRLGLKISEKGVYRADDPTETPIGPMDTETQVFEAVGLPYIAPEIRAGTREVELAERGELPDLVDTPDLRGDFQVYSAASGGRDTVEALARHALELGYSWLVVAERTRGLAPEGLADDELRRAIDAVREANERIEGIDLKAGASVAIRPEGFPDADLRILADCDWVVATVIEPTGGANEVTRQICWALETGVVSCLGAPTGRKLGIDDGHELYWDEIMETAADYGVAMAINAHPSRLDLNATEIGRVKRAGGMLALGSDSGSRVAMDQIRYGLVQARRAWLEPQDLLNTLSFDAIRKRVRTLR
jgi:DNA polymerase (family 10)